MLSFFYSSLKHSQWLILSSVLFNSFGFKLFIDIGNYNIIDPYLFFHVLMAIFMAICLSIRPLKGAANWAHYLAIPLTAWPTLAFMVIKGPLSILHASLYIAFLLSVCTSIYFISRRLSSYQPAPRLFYILLILTFLWGNTIIIENIPYVYDTFAPFTLMYHFSLLSIGIVHIGTVVYLIILPLICASLARNQSHHA